MSLGSWISVYAREVDVKNVVREHNRRGKKSCPSVERGTGLFRGVTYERAIRLRAYDADLVVEQEPVH
jgi:hypothetical protein